jgi:hypothetical protein
MMKYCPTCNTDFPLSAYSVDRCRPDGLNYECRNCGRERLKFNRLKLRKRDPIDIISPSEKICNKCGQLKRKDDFFAKLDRLDGISNQCKTCDTAINLHYRGKRLDDDPVKYKLNRMFLEARKRAKQQNVSFELTEDYLWTKFSHITHCPVFDIEFDWRVVGQPQANSPSLDKIVPDIGYVPENVVIISQRANMMKRDASLAELRLFCNYYTTLIDNREERGSLC